MANQGEEEESRTNEPEGLKSVVDDVYNIEDDPVVGRFNRFGTEMSAMVSALTQVVSARSQTSSSVEAQGSYSSSSSVGHKRRIDSAITSSFASVDSCLGSIGESMLRFNIF